MTNHIKRKLVIAGIVMPHNWDEAGRIIEIALYTNTEQVYAVEQNSLTQKLTKLIHKRVEVTGNISEHPDGHKSIVAQNYIELKETFEHE